MNRGGTWVESRYSGRKGKENDRKEKARERVKTNSDWI